MILHSLEVHTYRYLRIISKASQLYNKLQCHICIYSLYCVCLLWQMYGVKILQFDIDHDYMLGPMECYQTITKT